MIETTVTIKNRAGLHVRPAAAIVKTASQYQSEFFIYKDSYEINGKSIIGVMTLEATQGTKLILHFDGPDELEASEKMKELFEQGFGEPM